MPNADNQTYFPFFKRISWADKSDARPWQAPIDIGELKILLVEDDEDDYIIIRDMLSDVTGKPLKMEWSTTYEAGLEALRRQQHDVCLLDYYLGQHTGLELLQEMSDKSQNVPIIMLTGLGNHQVDVQAMEAGAADYLVKGEIHPYLLERSIRYAVRHRQVLRALQQREDRFRSLVQNSSDVIGVLREDSTYQYVSDSCRGILGYAPEDLVGKKSLDFVHPEDISVVQEALRELKACPDDVLSTEFRFLHGDGTWRILEATGNNLLDHPFIEGIVVNTRDVTMQRQAEKKIERYAAELKRSNKELEQFAYVISHDLQEPARMVESYLKLLRRRYQGQLDDKADVFIDYAVDGAKRMQEMIAALLDLSRVETLGAAFTPTDVEAVLERTLRSLNKTIEDADAHVTHSPLPTVAADQAQLAQVFQNLIINAIKFQREGVPPRVHIAATPKDAMWVFSVADNGIGINPKQTDRIFQIFQRLHTREEYPGTGIGLALCKRIVERHSGQIWVESTPNKGSTFFFTLPALT